MLLTPAQIKPKPLNRDGTLFFLLGVDAPHVYVLAWALGCFHGLISTQNPSTGLPYILPSTTAVYYPWVQKTVS